MPHGIILLVEDDARLAELTTAFLLKGEGGPSEVVVASDGVEAIDYLHDPGRGASEMPHLVLLDLNMPRLDGFGVLKKMRAEERTMFVPVVMLTSSDRSDDVRTAYRLGANGYLDKMPSRVSWEEMVQTVARFWVAMNMTPYSLAGQDNGFARRTRPS